MTQADLVFEPHAIAQGVVFRMRFKILLGWQEAMKGMYP